MIGQNGQKITKTGSNIKTQKQHLTKKLHKVRRHTLPKTKSHQRQMENCQRSKQHKHYHNTTQHNQRQHSIQQTKNNLQNC